MNNRKWDRALKFSCMIALGGMVAGCSAIDRLARVGEFPELKPIENPVRAANYEPVTLPMPRPETISYEPNSLWRTGSKAFFKDQRASRVGDILTVNIVISDSASLENSTERSRKMSEDDNIGTLFGYEEALGAILPEAVNPANILDLDSKSSNTGQGSVAREEDINLKIAAIVTQALPNGNLVISGRQEMRVNYEVRELWITGVVRPEDISSQNTIDYDKIAEARVVYGGRGVISDIQQPRYGTQVLDIIYPF